MLLPMLKQYHAVLSTATNAVEMQRSRTLTWYNYRHIVNLDTTTDERILKQFLQYTN
jgi:glycosylphosphatidylinositol transamidase (GPIT) subunit GPI8